MSGIQPGISGIGGVQPTFGETQIGQEAQKILFFDELSTSEKKELLELIYAAQNPVLIPPNLYQINSSDPSIAVGIMAEQSRHDTIMTMLDSWIENIKKIEEENKRADLKRTLDGISIAFHSYQHSVNPQSDPNFPTFSVGIILGAIGAHQAILSTPVTHVAMNPIVNMASSAFPITMGDMRAELGLIGTLVIFGYGLQYGAVTNQIKSTEAQKYDEKATARNFAENVLSLISDEKFNTLLLAIVSQNISNGQPLSEERKQQMAALVKLVLLASALAALYQSETGRMTSEEFGAMFKKSGEEGAITFAKDDYKNQFIDAIRLELKRAGESEDLLVAMMQFFDADPSINTLTDPAKVFAGINSTLVREEIQG